MDSPFRKLGRIALGVDIENMGQRRHLDIEGPEAQTMISPGHPCGIRSSMMAYPVRIRHARENG